MAIKKRKKNSAIALTIALILVLTIAYALSNGFSRSNIRTNTSAIVNQGLKQPTTPTSVVGFNETSSLNATNSYLNNSFAQINNDPVPLDTFNSTTYSHLDMSGFFFPPSFIVGQSQITGLDPNNTSYVQSNAVPVSFLRSCSQTLLHMPFLT